MEESTSKFAGFLASIVGKIFPVIKPFLEFLKDYLSPREFAWFILGILISSSFLTFDIRGYVGWAIGFVSTQGKNEVPEVYNPLDFNGPHSSSSIRARALENAGDGKYVNGLFLANPIPSLFGNLRIEIDDRVNVRYFAIYRVFTFDGFRTLQELSSQKAENGNDIVLSYPISSTLSNLIAIVVTDSSIQESTPRITN